MQYEKNEPKCVREFNETIDDLKNKINTILDDNDVKIYLPVSVFHKNIIVNNTEYDVNDRNDQIRYGVKLSDEQLISLRRTGKFINAQDEWQVTRFLQSGTNNIKNSFYRYISNVYEDWIINFPNLINGNSCVSIKSSVKNIFNGCETIQNLLFGSPMMINQYSHEQLQKKMYEQLDNMFIQKYLIIDEGKLYYLTENNSIKLFTFTDIKHIIDTLHTDLTRFLVEWDRNAEDRQKKLYDELSCEYEQNRKTITKEKIVEEVVTAESDLKQNEIFKIINNNKYLGNAETDYLLDLLNNTVLIKKNTAAYELETKIQCDIYMKKIISDNPIRSMIKSWVIKKELQFKKKYKECYENNLEQLIDSFDNQQKFVYVHKQKIEQSPEYKTFCDNLKNSKLPLHTFQIKYKYWNYVHNISTNFYGWRVCYVFSDMLSNINNTSFNIVRNIISSRYYSLKYISCIKKYDYHDSITGCKSKHPTLVNDVKDIWKDVSKKITEFRNESRERIFGRKISNCINFAYNFLRGSVSTCLILSTAPLLTLILLMFRILILFLSPVYFSAECALKYLFSILIKDTLVKDVYTPYFPLIYAVIEKILLTGVGQMMLTGTILVKNILYLAVTITLLTPSCAVKYIYDSIIYYFLLQRYAKVPQCEDFLTKKIRTPSHDNFILVDKKLALVEIQKSIEQSALEMYKKDYADNVNKPVKQLMNCLKKMDMIGLCIDNNSDFIQNIKSNIDKKICENNTVCKNFIVDTVYVEKNISRNKYCMTDDDLQFVLTHGAAMCKSYYEKYIVNRYQNVNMLWDDKIVVPNDWRMLVEHILTFKYGKSVIDNKIITHCKITKKMCVDENSYNSLCIDENCNKHTDTFEIYKSDIYKKSAINNTCVTPFNMFNNINIPKFMINLQ